MKRQLQKLKEQISKNDIPVAQNYRSMYLKYNLYSCFTIAVDEAFDMEEYSTYLLRAVIYYLSLDFVNYSNRINFVASFFESYIMFDTESILNSVADASSILYDDSLESLLARALAISENEKQDSCINQLKKLEKTLQESENMV